MCNYQKNLLFLFYFISTGILYAAGEKPSVDVSKILESPVTKECLDVIPIGVKKVLNRPSISKPNYENDRQSLKQTFITQYNPEEIKVTTTDGTQIDAFLLKRPHAKRVILLCHGYWVSKEYLSKWVDLFPNDTIYIPDLRAHGDSSGDFISVGYYETQDIKAGLDFLTHNNATKNLPIIGVGASMGGLIMLKTAVEDKRFTGIILDSTLTDPGYAICRFFWKWSGFPACNCKLIQDNFEQLIHAHINDTLNPFKLVKNLITPILIIHSTGDQLVPWQDINKLYNEIPGKKELWIVPNNSIAHVDIIKKSPKDYKDKVYAFIATL